MNDFKTNIEFTSKYQALTTEVEENKMGYLRIRQEGNMVVLSKYEMAEILKRYGFKMKEEGEL